MADSYQTDWKSLTRATSTTTVHVSHEPQHWHHHHMTEIISSTPPPHPTHNHHSHHHSHSHSHPQMAYTIRPGTRADLNAIHKIYTYYALNSSITLLVHAPDIKYMEKAYDTSLARHMPYLVAVTRLTNSSKSSVETTHNHEDSEHQNSNAVEAPTSHQNTTSQENEDVEIVLGYGHLVPLHADKAGYGPSVELTMYVHPSYLNFGIGSALLSALELQLREHPILIFEDGYADKGVERPAEVIVSRMSDDMERDFEGVKMDDGGEWPVWKAQGEKNKEWYVRHGFEEVGRMKRVGEKFGKKTDVIILQKTLISA